jgi:hypothetical protein
MNQTTEEGLNIFGLLRTDSTAGFNKSFVYVHKILPAMKAESFNILKYALVRIDKIDQEEATESVVFTLTPPGSAFADTSYRPVTNFSPDAGERYRIICKYEGLPDAVGETIIPSVPQIKPGTMSVRGKTVTFSLAPDSLSGMTDIYQRIHNTYIPLLRLVPSPDKETPVELTLPFDPPGTKLVIYAYDHNMAAYIGNSNISLNFNKFRTTISTLKSGFGVFGSMNFREVELLSGGI